MRHQARRSFFETLEDRSLMATLTWVGDLDANWNSGTSGTDTNWDTNTLPADGDTLVFAGAAAGVLNNDTTADNSYTLQFTAPGYTINGNRITLDNAGDDITDNSANLINTALVLDASSTANIPASPTALGGVISGVALTKTGAGTLVLSNNNSYTGGTTASAGTINVGNAGALGTGSVTNNALVDLNAGGVNYTFAGMSGNGTTRFLLGTGVATTTVAAGSYAGFTGNIVVGIAAAPGAGKLQINNMSTLPAAATINVQANATVFASAGTYVSPITLNGGDTGESQGQLRLEGATYNGSVTLAAPITGVGDAFVGGSAGTGTIGGIISETGGPQTLSKVGAGTIQLTNANTYTGGTNIVSGVLSVGSGGATGTLGSGTVAISGTLQVNRSNAIAISNAITSPGSGILTKLGAGTLTFTVPGGGNVFKTVNVNSNSTIDFGSGNTTINNAGGSTIQSSTGGTINATAGTLLLGSASVTDGGNVGTANGTTLTINAVMNLLVPTNAFEAFQVANGTGVVVLTATNQFAGPVVISSGVLSVANIGNSGVASNLGSGSTINLGTGTTAPTLRYTGTGETTNRVVNLSGATNLAAIEHNGSGALNFSSNFTATGAGSKTLVLKGTATGANAGRVNGIIPNNSGVNLTSLAKDGSGQWLLNAANTYTGVSTVLNGSLLLGANNAINSGNTVTVNATGAGITATFDLNGFNQTVGTLTLGGTTATSTPVVAGAASTLTSSGDIVYNATSNPLGGTISVTTLDLNAAAPRIMNVGNSTSAANDLTITSVIQNGGVRKDGAGLLQFGGLSANTYVGDTTVNAGELDLNKPTGIDAIAGGTLTVGDSAGGNDVDIVKLLAANEINNAVNVSVNNSGLFNLNGLNETIAALALQTGTGQGGSITTGAGTLTLGGNVTVTNAAAGDTTTADITGNLDLGSATRTFTVADATVNPDLTVAGVVSNGGVTKTGAGQMAYTGAAANTYVGDTKVNDGTLITGKTGVIAIAGNIFLGDGAGAANSAVLQLGGTGGNEIADTADVTINAIDGRLNLNGVNEKIDALNGGGAINSGIAGAVTLTVGENNEAAFTYGGVISNGSGTVNITKDGTGTFTLSNANTYTGTTTINSGELDLTGSLTSNVVVNNSAFFAGSGSTSGTIQANATAHVSPGVAGATVARLTTTAATTLTVNTTLDIELAGTAGAGVAGGNDQLRTNGVTLSAANLNLTGAYVPTPGTLTSFTIIDNTSASPTVSRLTYLGVKLEEGAFLNFNGQKLFISYLGGDGNDVVLSTQLMGSAVPDLLTITPVNNTSIQYTFAGHTFTTDGTINRFTFNGLGGDDAVVVTMNGSQLPTGGLFYNGGTQDAPLTNGANALHGDVLSVLDGTHLLTANYQADGVVNAALDNDGAVTVLGIGVINFTTLEPVDIGGFLNANITFPNGNDVINLANGFDAASNVSQPAIVVSGTSGGVPFEAAHLAGNTNVTIDTTTVDGNDTVTIASANNAHANRNLTIKTGTGVDSVTFTGNATFAGDVTINSQNIAFNGGLLTAGATNTISLNAGTGAITTNGTGVDVNTQNLNATATTGIDLDTTIVNITANNTGAGNIRFDETDGVTLTSVTAANGSTIVNAAGTVNVTSVTSTTDNDANDVSILTTTGNIVVTTITTGGTASDVSLTATTGSILDDANDSVTDITGDVVTLTAGLGIGESAGNGSLDTVAQSITASVTGTGLINLNELDAVTLTSVTTANGPITINAGGAILATSVVSMTSTNDANDINITAATGDITIGVINAGTSLADVTVTATTGSLIDNGNDTVTDVTGDVVSLNAPAGKIGDTGTKNIDTAANTITFAAANGAWINELNAVTVVASAGSATGPVVFSAGGNITLNTTMNAVAGNVLVTTTNAGSNLIFGTGALITSGAAAGAVRLNIANSIVDTQTTNDILATNVNITTGNDIGTAADPIETTITNLAVSTGVGGDLYLNEADDLNLDTVTAFGVTLSGLSIGGITVVNTGSTLASTSATLSVKQNVTGAGDVTLRSNDRSGANDTVALSNGITIKSTTGNLTLGFGDDEILNATHTLDVAATKTINLLSNDVDNGSHIQLQGTISAKTVNVVGANNNDFFVLKPDTIFDAASTLNLTGKDGSDQFGNSVERINPTNATINIEGDTLFNNFPENRPGSDSLYLDASLLSPPVVFFAGKVKGTLEGGDAAYQKVNYEDLESLTFYDNGTAGANSGDLNTVILGALYVRGTPGDDYVNFIRSGTFNSTDVTAILRWSGKQKYFGPFPMGPVDATTKLEVFGKEGNDRITDSLSGNLATTNRDVEFHGGLGDDYLVGGTGNCLMIGDEGNDIINTSASLGTSVIWGDAEGSFNDHEGSIFDPETFPDGNDNIVTGAGNDIIYGGGGNDAISAAAGNDIVYGGVGDDTIYGGDGNDLLRGSSGNDVLSGDNGDDIVLGGDGNDRVYGRAGADIVIGGAGNDIVSGDAGNDVVTGGLASGYDEQATLVATQALDAALLALLGTWTSSGTFSATITDDGIYDNVNSGTENDLLYVHETPLVPATDDINDFNSTLDHKVVI